jgi:uncharacterized repeat protein (TIGR03843 family)
LDGRPPDDQVEDLLRCGEVTLVGRMPWSSNATFLVDIHAPGTAPDPEAPDDPDAPMNPALLQAIYKPHRGERPLWDFPDGLWRREVAAYELSRALGWAAVPETIEREGPLGVGSLQRFIDADFGEHYFTLLEDEAYHPQLRRLCAFDLVANSTDRKGGHILVDDDAHLWGIDNGLSFHAEFKLRTVIWDFAGERVPNELAEDLATLVETDLPDRLARLLDPFERDALRTRARAVLSEGCFPHDTTGRRYPWPMV